MDERRIVQSPVEYSRGLFQRKTWGEGSLLPRVRAIEPYVRGKDVLDLGCASGRRRDDWVHGQLAEVTRTLVGVDLDRDGVDELNERGFDVRFGDAETFRVDDRFDVVFAGEIIEHLDCFRGLLDTARVHLRTDGRLVLTTPNAFGFSNFVYRLRGKVRVNADHTCWFCETTLAQLLDRCGFEVDEITYLRFDAPGRLRGPIAGLIRRILPDRLAWSTLIAIARPRSGADDTPATSTTP